MSNMKLIRISGIESESIVDGEGIRYVIFTQGCPHHCPGCHNPQTHPFGGGKLVSIEDILDDISKRKNWIDGITISGGEPFCQIYQCALIAEKAHEMGLSVWCYTGYLFEDLYGQGIELLKHIDVLVDGPFVQAEKSLELDFRGSRNQRVIDIPESLKEGVAILKQNILENCVNFSPLLFGGFGRKPTFEKIFERVRTIFLKKAQKKWAKARF